VKTDEGYKREIVWKAMDDDRGGLEALKSGVTSFLNLPKTLLSADLDEFHRTGDINLISLAIFTAKSLALTVFMLLCVGVAGVIVGGAFLLGSVLSKLSSATFVEYAILKIDEKIKDENIDPNLSETLCKCKVLIKTAEDAERVLKNLGNKDNLEKFIEEKKENTLAV
jgi:hypothetical protein